jgi:ADP-ribose pyrophosphatase
MRPTPLLPGSVPFPGGVELGELWEIPAGLIEESERTPEGILACVVRETLEEIGFRIPTSAVRPLGGPVFPSAGVIGECIYLFEAEVDPDTQEHPEGDGPLEHGARVIQVPLSEALGWCDNGLLPDMKTELALRRLALVTRESRS